MKVGISEIDAAEVGFAERGIIPANFIVNIVLPPLIPYLHSLFKNIKMLLVSHTISLACSFSCFVPQF